MVKLFVSNCELVPCFGNFCYPSLTEVVLLQELEEKLPDLGIGFATYGFIFLCRLGN